jgi:hypothetical protein
MNYNFPIAFFDAPEIVNTTVTPIPGSGSLPLQVIADSGTRSAVAIDFIDTTGDFIGVYLGAAGQEKLLCIIGNGQTSRAWGVFAAHSRVSLRSMTPSPITNGTVVGTLMSY